MKTNRNGSFLDTPGLADETLRKVAGKSISAGLRKGGNYKVIFLFTEQSGRVNVQDATSMQLVLQAAPDIGNRYGIIVNKVDAKVIEKIRIDQGQEFLQILFSAIPDYQRCRSEQILFLPACMLCA